MENNTANAKNGTLYIVATPIGNLKDITHRAVEILSSVDWIAAEDTRHTQKLLQALMIQRPLISLHDHNEQARSTQLLERLQQGESGALVSDAGTPLINDPGFHLVKLLRQQGVEVVPIPGPSAVITALCAAGLPTDRFSYEGFLPAKNQKRLDVLEGLKNDTRTLVFYESPHRLMDTLAAMESVFGESRQMVAAREMTKTFEQFVSGSVAEVVAYFTENSDKVRGEFVLMVMGDVIEEETDVGDFDDLILSLLKQNLPVKQITDILVDYSGQKKKAIYSRVQELKDR
ncbi:16S rRNA (cytidine(1402)-2'-O)-methyltransferase [Thiomicrorhabdus sp. ZW0627]|uniref:16S rRNA (cytidine(1402)-2'-O)-methyltransferase n=1 Tax=Thiomicrorhabdus sp. ZW0627 TaxID=3039774 RepID=UPI002436B926|nr:16S rRNA (cytidine(1402)-2'-O)-methyltransferase [Thiomicrorhabdus sp. ZW0627]MDG6774000.1 16S rRNA (cytidine(1402)-2'-O)-methyltransferase [Thiomicrorhabdus sp. ZW0627]